MGPAIYAIVAADRQCPEQNLEVAVSLFDMRGRLIGQMPAQRAGVILRHGAAEGIVLAKVKVVR